MKDGTAGCVDWQNEKTEKAKWERVRMLSSVDVVPQEVVREGLVEAPVVDIPVFNCEGEEALALRFGKKSKEKQNLVFEFTREPDLIHQYFRIYQSECRMIPEFLKDEEEYNRKSHILVVRDGNMVIGGARLFIKSPRLQKKFLLELAGFDLNSHFPELDAKQMRYAELSRLVLLPDYRKMNILKEVLFHIGRKCVAMDLDVFFAAAPVANVRFYKLICNGFGYNEATIHYNIDIPPDPGFEEVKDYLFSVWRDRSRDSFFLAEKHKAIEELAYLN